jgi:Transposase DDE domain/Domain of unknown function (DUF4372)
VKTTTPKPTRSPITALRQLCNLIPNRLVSDLAAEAKDAPKARTYSYWSQVVALIYAQLTHAVGLNDVCDSLRLHSGPLSAIRGATPPSRNNLSHANKQRPASIAEALFWKVLAHLRTQHKGFGGAHSGKRLAHRFKCAIHVVDSTTIELIANCMDWARHRRRKAAAKCHLRLNLQSFLPSFAIVDTAKHNDNKRAREVCAGIHEGEIVLFDKAYVDFEHLCDLDARGVFWVTRAKDNMAFNVVKCHLRKPKGKILRDDAITLRVGRSRAAYGQKRLRRIVALVEVEGVEREMVFITNNFDWAASTVADLYKCRWQIEVFFKQIKQTLQLADFLGNSANAVRWQVWIALLVYVLLRFQAWASNWGSSFIRLWASVRSALWLKLDLVSLLKSYGTAGGSFRLLSQPEQAYLPGLRSLPMG